MTDSRVSPRPSTSQVSTSLADGGSNDPLVVNGRRRARRVGRRRRGHRGDFDSDEEIEREAGTDTEPESFSDASGSDSESESGLESLINASENRRSSNISSRSVPETSAISNPTPPGFVDHSRQKMDWSETVQTQSADGGIEELPVLEFDQLIPSETINRVSAMASVPDTSVRNEYVTYRSRSPGKSFPKTSARHAYQKRLSEDPSYVPVVGEFWGHDDRLMEKGLRSLSGWWRGRWQTRGRAVGTRGSWIDGRGRGRGGSVSHQDGSAQVSKSRSEEQMWSHDAFEAMNSQEGRRPRRVPQSKSARRTEYAVDGDRPSSGTSTLSTQATAVAHAQAQAVAQGRPWYWKRPERSWSKQFDSFLFTDTEARFGPNLGQSLRVRLPNADVSVVKVIYRPSSNDSPHVPSASLDEQDTDLTVRLPLPRRSQEHPDASGALEGITTAEEFQLPRINSDIAKVDNYDMQNQLNSIGELATKQTPSEPNASDLMSSEVGVYPSLSHQPDHFGMPYGHHNPYDMPSILPQGVVLDEGGLAVNAMPGHPIYLHQQHPHGMQPLYQQPPYLPGHPSITQAELLGFSPSIPGYMGTPYFDNNGLQFSLPRQNSRIEIRPPRASEKEHESPSITQRAGVDLRANVGAAPFQPSFDHAYYARPAEVDMLQGAATNNLGAMSSSELELPMQPVMYQGMQYYVPPYAMRQYPDAGQNYNPYGESQPIYY